MAAKALDSFLRQTYTNRELVILDDADDPSFPQGVTAEGVRYWVINERLNIPQKRNRINAMTNGDCIAHWDSDDWSEPERMAEQVALLESSGKPVVGYNNVTFINPEGNLSKYYGKPDYALGTSLCYFKWWWELHKFREDRPVGSDNAFVGEAGRAKQIACVDGGTRIIARIHSGNTSKKPSGYSPVAVPLPVGFS